MAKAKMNETSKNLYLARALYDAVEDCNIQQVNFLLCRNKANPNILIPEDGMTAFHLAAGHENVAFGKVAVSLFLHNGGDPNVRCDGNRTVLHIAVAWNRSSVVEILLKSTNIIPNPYLKDEDDLNVFNYAVKFNSWESLATLQCYMKHINHTNDSNIQICQTTQSINWGKRYFSDTKDQKTDQSIGAESTFNKSEKLHTSSGYFNSGESLNNTSISKKCDLTSPKNNISNESSLTADSLADILNKNIPIENDNTSILDEKPLNIHVDRSMSSIRSMSDKFEDIERISFPSFNSIADSELSQSSDDELRTENIFSQSISTCSNISELMTDISGLTSCLGSDDYFTCPDTNSKQNNSKKKTNKDAIQLEDVLNISMTSLCDSISNPVNKITLGINKLEDSDNSINSSDSSDESSSLTEITEDYDTDYIRHSLRKFGYPPGPVVPTTKHIYVRKLNQIRKDQVKLKPDKHNILFENTYSIQLTKVLIADDRDTWKTTIKSWGTLEESIVSLNGGGSSFTYLLIDPRITKNLPARADNFQNPIKVWQTFIRSIFYIGKGSKSRPNDHMTEAFNSWIGKNKKEISQKTEYILSLWKENMGVVCVQAFHHLNLKEAHIREAAMIDAIGLEKLTNEKRGTYYDHTVRWRYSDRCKLGCYLLNRAMFVFLADGERQLKPIDLT